MDEQEISQPSSLIIVILNYVDQLQQSASGTWITGKNVGVGCGGQRWKQGY